LPLGVFGLHGCLLKTCDDFVAEGQAVADCPERVRMSCHAGNHIEVDLRAASENQVSIGKRRNLPVRACVLDLVLL
jgi:hypothetical protein